MEKHYLLLIVLFLALTSIQAQPLEYNFDSYTAGQQIAQTAGLPWTTWSGTTGNSEDPIVSNEQSVTTPNSINVITGNDNVLLLGDKVTGRYKVSFSIYIPSTKVGYYNLLQSFGATNIWGLQVYFNAGGSGSVDAGAQSAATFSYPIDEWFQVENYIDLDNDLAELVINGNSIYQWQWSLSAFGGGSLNQLAAMNLYGGTADDDFYVDNVVYSEAPNVPLSNWAIYIGILLIGMFMFVGYRRRMIA